MTIPLKNLINEHLFNHQQSHGDNNDSVSLNLKEVNNVCGTLLLYGGPFWCYVIEDSSYKLPCVMIDKTCYLMKLIDLHGCSVEIEFGNLIIESCLKSSEVVFSVYLQCSPENIKLLKRPSITTFDIIPEHWNQRVLLIHTTPPIFIKNLTVFCLILVMIIRKSEEDPSYLWILLKESQVAWHELLIPNREYIFHMAVPMDYFKKEIRPLRAVLGKIRGVQVFKEIIHHPEFWPTIDATELPSNTNVSVGPSLKRSVYNCQFPAPWWLSVNEALFSNDSPIMTIWGEVTKVSHIISEERDGCSLCTKQNLKNVIVDKDIDLPDPTSWTNPWESSLNFNKNVSLPNIENIEISGNFLPEKMTKMIVLKDIKNGETVTLYLKKWESHHYNSIFVVGAVVCAKFLHKRVSAKKIPYFVTCALSCFEVVGTVNTIRELVSSASIPFGFPFKVVKPGTKSWGILDQWSLINVSLKYDVSNQINNSFKNSKFSATAIVQLVRHSGNSLNIIFKNEQVKLLLEIPDEVWYSLKIASKRNPLSYNNREREVDNSESAIQRIFYAFCEMRNASKKRFHISCRFLAPKQGEDEVFFCTSIGDGDPEHLLNISKPNVLTQLLNISFGLCN